MAAFVLLPLCTVLVQSVFRTETVFEQVRVESCTPGFVAQTCTTELRARPKPGLDGAPETRTAFIGLDAYRELLQPGAVAAAFAPGGGGIDAVLNIDFWRALRFTLTFTLVTWPLVIGAGLAIALLVDNVVQAVRGPLVFVSLLPFIVTPVIGSLSVRWLFAGDGILTAGLRALTGTHVSLFAQGWTVEALMVLYRVWHEAPFAFLVFYAGLQSVGQDTMEAAAIDGATRWERLRFVVLAHLWPLVVFVTLIHLMDAYRAFDEVVGFSSQAYRISLQYLTFSLLTPDDSGNRAVTRASASAMLTMLGIAVLLVPVVAGRWRERGAR